MKEICRDFPEWLYSDQATPQNASLTSSDNGCNFNFSSVSADLSVMRDVESAGFLEGDVETLGLQIDRVMELVLDRLEINEISRIGSRFIFTYGFDSETEIQNWIASRKLWEILEKSQSLVEGTIISQSMNFEIESSDRTFRIQLGKGERPEVFKLGKKRQVVKSHELPKHQKEALLASLREKKFERINSPYIALLDVDVSRKNPESLGIQCGDFCTSSFRIAQQIAMKVEQNR